MAQIPTNTVAIPTNYLEQVTSYLPQDRFVRYFLMAVLVAGLVLFVWWFAKRVIGRDLQVPKTYDPNQNNQGNTNTGNQGNTNTSNNQTGGGYTPPPVALTPEAWNKQQSQKIRATAKAYCPSDRKQVYENFIALPNDSIRAIDAAYRNEFKSKIRDDVDWAFCDGLAAGKVILKMKELGLDK